jgi:GlpG protein
MSIDSQVSTESATEQVATQPPADAGAETTSQLTKRPWVSTLSIAACITVYLGLLADNNYRSWDTLAEFGYLPADAIWKGGYWALVTSAFVHFEVWHVAFNVYWLWVLGSRLERAIGSLHFLGFIVTSAFVSSSFQLSLSDDTGIGASGVVYAMFGFMWLTRRRWDDFSLVLDTRTIQTFVVWLVACVIVTYLDIWNVGNAAHISGLLFGGAVAGAFVLDRKRLLAIAGLVVLVAFSVIPLFWCPWSVTWLSIKAYEAHAAARYQVAIDRYTQITNLEPNNAWAYLNRSYAYNAVGRPEEAEADLRKAREINPTIDQAK